jgi:hypothetical protein
MDCFAALAMTGMGYGVARAVSIFAMTALTEIEFMQSMVGQSKNSLVS